MLCAEICELLGTAGGRGDQVTRLERGADKGAAEATRGTGDEPDLFHVS